MTVIRYEPISASNSAERDSLFGLARSVLLSKRAPHRFVQCHEVGEMHRKSAADERR
jgi:hypothetical protein